ncbi:MAG: hypothetical protein ACFFDT_40740, partial [Candidatus Hodarchaeota archaeon]
MAAKRLRPYVMFVLLLLLFFINLDYVQLSAQELGSSELEVPRSVSENLLDVNFWVFLGEHYEFLELDVRDMVIINISFNLTVPPIVPQTITVGIPFSLGKISGLPEGGSYTYGFWGYPPRGVLTIYLPAYTRYSSIRLEGYLSSKSVFWRNSVEIPSLNVTSSLIVPSYYNLILVPPSASRVLRVYSRFYPDLSYRKATIEGWDSLVISGVFVPMVVLYEPEVWQTYAFVVMLVIIFSVYAVLYVEKWRTIFDRASKLMTRLSILVPVKLFTIFRTLYNVIIKLDSSRLLTIYILFALLMVSLSFSAGPDPRLKVYVLSSTSENASVISDFVSSEVNGFSITVFDEMSEFELLADLGVFQAVIVGDFFPPTRKVVETYIYPGLDVVPQIVVVEDYAFSEFLSELQARYFKKTIVVNDLVSLRQVLRDIPKRTNALGLQVGSDTYKSVSGLVGFSSLLLPFFGLAFLSCKLIEVGRKPLVSGFVEAIAFSVLVFFFTQAIYIACSVLLAMPLGLHTSSPKVTAIGFMGFGGGTRPRMFAGLAGFLFGALISLKGGVKLDKTGFLSFAMMVFFVIVDPLTSGLIFYE